MATKIKVDTRSALIGSGITLLVIAGAGVITNLWQKRKIQGAVARGAEAVANAAEKVADNAAPTQPASATGSSPA